MNFNKTRKHLIITAAVMLFIFIQSALPGDTSGAESGWIVRIAAALITAVTSLTPDSTALSFAVRKLAHFSEYAILGACILQNVIDWQLARPVNPEAGDELKPRHLISLAWILSVAYAVTDEIHQIFVDGRSCEVRDVCIDACGAALGALVLYICSSRTVLKLKNRQ